MEDLFKKIKLPEMKKYNSDMKNIVDGINTAKGKNSELEDNINRNYPI